jgi:hypothetical protein
MRVLMFGLLRSQELRGWGRNQTTRSNDCGPTPSLERIAQINFSRLAHPFQRGPSGMKATGRETRPAHLGYLWFPGKRNSFP